MNKLYYFGPFRALQVYPSHVEGLDCEEINERFPTLESAIRWADEAGYRLIDKSHLDEGEDLLKLAKIVRQTALNQP